MNCIHCGENITFGPWFTDGRTPTRLEWQHTRTGARSCSPPGREATPGSPVADPGAEALREFDGCRRDCRRYWEHTYIHGECEKGVRPEPTVSLSRSGTGDDGERVISFDTYTTEGLADLIEPALKAVKVTLGPNSLTALEHGAHLTLTSGEIRAMALEAAHAIIHRNDPQERT